MVVAIIAWIFTLVCVALAVFFIIRGYRGWKRMQNEQEIRQIIAMQEAANFARDAKARKAGEPTDTTRKPIYPMDDTYGLPEIPDEIPDR